MVIPLSGLLCKSKDGAPAAIAMSLQALYAPCFLQIAEEGFLESRADADIDVGEKKISRLVIESGIAAIDQPAR